MVRAVALVVAMLSVASPVAAAVCQATCAADETPSMAAHHTCHQQRAAEQGPAMAAVHVCGHEDGAPSAIDRPVTAAPNLPAITSSVTLLDQVVQSAFVGVSALDSSPPTFPRLVSQLRV